MKEREKILKIGECKGPTSIISRFSEPAAVLRMDREEEREREETWRIEGEGEGRRDRGIFYLFVFITNVLLSGTSSESVNFGEGE